MPRVRISGPSQLLLAGALGPAASARKPANRRNAPQGDQETEEPLGGGNRQRLAGRNAPLTSTRAVPGMDVMPPLRFGRVETSIGPMWVAETDGGVAAAARSEPLGAFLEALHRRFRASHPEPGDLSAEWVEATLDGSPPPPVDMRGLSPFDVAVYGAVRAIPRGHTMTYGEVAALIGSPGAARAVGGAMSRCPLFPAVPCHRVVRAADGWSGWGGDVALKRRLLRREREAIGKIRIVAPRA